MRVTAQVLLKIPLYQSFRAFGYPKMLPMNYTFLISTQCNSRCLTCKIWKQKHDELTLKEWKKVFKSLGASPFWVTVSGGEPFLQDHLVSMVVALDKLCQPAIINIPTNGLLPESTGKQVARILKRINAPQLIINLSLDGIGKAHDRIRGTSGNFAKVMATYKKLQKIQEKQPRLTIGFGTVISNYNLGEIKNVSDLAFRLEPDQYVTEIAEERVELNTVGLPVTPSLKKYGQAIDCLIEKMREHRFTGIGRVSRAFRFQYYQFVKDWLAEKKLLPDYAGFASCEITSWGEVWPSCIKGEKMGNVRRNDYDFFQVWFSPKADKIRQAIKKRGSSYPLANSFYSSALHHWPTLAKVSWRVVFP